MAAATPPGGRARAFCPFCNATHEQSFSVMRGETMPHKLYFQCFRGSCGKRGMVEDNSGLRMILWSDQKDVPHQVSKQMPEYAELTQEQMNFLCDRFELTIETIATQGIRDRALDASTTYASYAMPWLDEAGYQKGWVEKRFGAIGGHKSHHDLCNRSVPGRLCFPRIDVSWHHAAEKYDCVLVEDIFSAYKVCQEGKEIGVVGVALLGAQISAVDAAAIGELFTHVAVMLDHDQWPNGSLRVVDHIKPYVEQPLATTLLQDPKDTPWEELQAHLRYITECFERGAIK